MSFIAPILPDNAPFSALQRAWLDGFLAGLFGNDAATAATAAVTPGVGAPEPAEDEAFPWHDPALPLDERLALAADRPPERQLMAAMGQLDCGQCGYLCQSYAEAIAHGEETQLTRCVPGGKPTSRALKELLAGFAAPAADRPAPTPITVAAPPAPSPATVDAPSPARLVIAQRLNRDSSDKD